MATNFLPIYLTNETCIIHPMQKATGNSIRKKNFIAITEKTVTLVVTDVYYKSTNVDVTNVFSKLILDSNLLSCKSQGVFQFTEQKIITTVISKGNGWTILRNFYQALRGGNCSNCLPLLNFGLGGLRHSEMAFVKFV